MDYKTTEYLKKIQSKAVEIEEQQDQNIDDVMAESIKNDYVNSYLERFMEDIQANKDKQIISTGFLGLNNRLGDGLLPGLHIIGAISSLGKTTFALQIADYIAGNQNTDVLFFSLEMSKFEMVAKSISRELFRISPQKAKNIGTIAIQRGRFSDVLPELNQAIQEYSKTAQRLSIIEGNFNTTVDTIRQRIEAHIKNTGNKPVVFIDYLQIIQGVSKGGSDKQEIDYNTTELKRISRDFNIPVIVISSLNRANYGTPISFESFKESGSIEYTSDTLVGLQLAGIRDMDHTEKNKIANKEKINQLKKEIPRKIELVILKNRNGSSYGSMNFTFYPVNNLFHQDGA